MALALNIGKCTLLGNYRENNEDSIDVKLFPDMTVCLVADGMGGQAAGEIASKRAIEIVPRELKKHLTGTDRQRRDQEHHPPVHRPGQRRNHGDGRPGPRPEEHGHDRRVAVWRKGSSILYVAGVGDSRVYHDPRQEDRAADRRSLDRPGAGRGQDDLRRRGQGRTATATCCGSTSARKEVGEGPEVKVVPIQAGDRFLLCTDGLTGVVPDEQLLNFIRDRTDMQECADGLGQLPSTPARATTSRAS